MTKMTKMTNRLALAKILKLVMVSHG